MVAHGPGHLVAQGIQISAAVVIDHAFRIAGGAGGVVQRDGLPLVGWPLPGERRVAFRQQRFIVQIADGLAFTVFRVVDVDDQRRVIKHADSGVNHVMELAVGDQHLGLAMLEHERNGFSIQAHVERVEHGADHRHAKMHFQHFRDIGQHHRHGVVFADAATSQRRGQASATGVGLRPGAANRAVDDGGVVGVNIGRALKEAERRQGDVIDSRRA
ncbi:hypothetical protein D3C84_539840 [compost metagenome]